MSVLRRALAIAIPLLGGAAQLSGRTLQPAAQSMGPAADDQSVTCDVAQRLEGKRRLARCRIGKGDLARLPTA
ncbi:hypothetical protein SLNSH_01850 [Alsobacter soli]|uniref:Uncharacterized protein n=1 Tax=Alsobacter soli TaxID=2109933 RepID=A0A2T1HYL5_9HYPH|nr:hypothetical protein [Alsobacter soli]PSC06579.1 hypothetical protein SLNSH_01850 [Alsobacter soli]